MLKKFVLWGHTLKDYQEMFNLSDEILIDNRIVEYGAGATSFNFEMQQLGHKVVSIDPMYALNRSEIKNIVEETFETTVSKIKNNIDKYNWKSYGDLTSLLEERRQGLELFYNDFDLGRQQGRYLSFDEGQALEIEDYSFDLALITHHLFVNFAELGAAEHLNLIKEMVRVAGEVRIFPLLNKYGETSQLLGPVMLDLQQSDFALEICQVVSQLQKGGNAMLRAWAVKCDVK